MQGKWKKLVLVLLVFSCVFTSVSLGSVTQAQAATKLYDVVFTKNKITIKKGHTYTLKMNYKDSVLSASKLNFKTSNSSVASVSKKGVIKGKKVGTAKITVTLKNNTKVKTTITVKVTTKSQQVVQGSTIKASNGVKIPVVSEFNKIGLIEGNDWTGEGTVGNDFDKAYGKALKEYSKKENYALHDSPILPAGDDTIHNGTAYDDMGPVTLMRNTDKGCYYFSYTMDISDLNDDAIKRQRDLSLFMLSMITLTPKEVEKAIYEDCFINSGDDLFPEREWVYVGDCKIMFTYGKHDPFLCEYKIAPAK